MKRTLLTVLLLVSATCFSPPARGQQTGSFDSLTTALIHAKDPAGKIRILLALSDDVLGNDPREGNRYARQALDLSVKHDLPRETILSLLQLGNGYIRVSDYQAAFENANRAMELAQEQKFDAEVAKAKKILALMYYELGDYETSARYDFENLKYYEGINNQKEIGIIMGNIGIDFTSQNNYVKGLEYLKKSFDIAVKNNDLHGMAYQYNNIAGVYSEYYHDTKIALRYYKEALKINLKLGDNQQHAIYMMNIGNCYSKLKEHDSVLVYYQPACNIFQKLNNLSLFAECQTQIGEHYLKVHNLPLSLKHADTAFKVSVENNLMENLKDASALLHRLHLARKDTILAYRYSKIEGEVKDSLMTLQNKKDVYKFEFQYNYEKFDKIRQIARQKKDNLMLMIILGLCSGIIIILLLFSRHRIKSKNIVLQKQSIEKELLFKNKELTINLISLIKKNEMLSDISKKMAEIGKAAKKDETKEAINLLNRELRSSTDDKMLKEFSLRFQEVHRGFYETLLMKYPDLTQSELKLCAFLRLNMSTKEISELTGQRILTIDHARYRLRKKLGISNSEINLVTFLSQI